MTDREKLIELINQTATRVFFKDKDLGTMLPLDAEIIADHLIANGVTVCERETLHQMYLQGKHEGAYEGQKWIPVTERLPEKNRDVLISFAASNMAVGFWYDGDEDISFWSAYTDDGFFADCDCEPTHWMPLPEPPKEGE